MTNSTKIKNNKKNSKKSNKSKKNVWSAKDNHEMTIPEYTRFQGSAQHAKELENLITLFESETRSALFKSLGGSTIGVSSDLFKKALNGNPIDVSADINRYHIFLRAEAIGKIMRKPGRYA